MNVLLLGSGGREHALAWKIAQSPLLTKLFIAPGNAGTLEHGTNVNLDPEDFAAVGAFVANKAVDMVIVGPEAPLVKGISDYFSSDKSLSKISVVGPSQAGALLEGSKDFAKAFMKRHNIPTAAYQTFSAENLDDGLQFLESLTPPYVLKADGLAAGKGVIITENLDEARQTLTAMIKDLRFGAASSKVVIEEFLEGTELSVFILTDGKNYLLLPEAKDYKRIGEGDTGPNTGGMGSVSPVPFASARFLEKIERQIIKPTMDGLLKENIKYNGFIFFGLINVEGNPKVIEYNCRMGDPEAEVIIPRIKSDLLKLFAALKDQKLNTMKLEIDTKAAAAVFMVSGGYPGNYAKGKPVSGLDQVQESLVFHAGTKKEDQQVVTSGGRVIAVTSLAGDIFSALRQSYANVEKIDFEGKNYRRDLGNDLQNF
jgi:phosphoribosylamine---glycine ligase